MKLVAARRIGEGVYAEYPRWYWCEVRMIACVAAVPGDHETTCCERHHDIGCLEPSEGYQRLFV